MLGLDLGGLSLLDFGDAEPETDTSILGTLSRLAISNTSDDEADDRSPCKPRPSVALIPNSPEPPSELSEREGVALEEQPEFAESQHQDRDDTHDEPVEGHKDLSAHSLGVGDSPSHPKDDEAVEEFSSRRSSLAAESVDHVSTPAHDVDRAMEMSELVGDESDLDPLPVPRSNSAVAVFSHFSPSCAAASPFIAPSPDGVEPVTLSPSLPPPPIATPGMAEDLASPLQTPFRPQPHETPLTARTPRQLGPLPTTAATPSRVRQEALPQADRTTKILKSQTNGAPSSNLADKAVIPTKDKSRALAVRGQLNAAFTGRSNKMGPPQRTVSASSSQSSSSSTSRPPSRLDTTLVSRKPHTKPDSSSGRPASTLSRAQTASTLAKAVSKTGLPTSNRPAPSLSSSLARATSSTVKPPPPTARQVLAPRSLITHPAKQPFAKPTISKIIRPIEAEQPAVAVVKAPATVISAPVNPLKRPFPSGGFVVPARQTVQAASASRPALGLPSRLVWDAAQGRHAQSFHIGAAPENTMARIAVRSPARQAAHTRLPGTPSRGAKVNTLTFMKVLR